MPKFFAKRKSNTDETENAQVTPPVQSFRVLERHEVPPVQGAARMPKGHAAQAASKPDSDDDDDDNMFSGMKPHNRGSAISNTTHATYTDNSSRHSNASTAPSSADCKNAYDESRLASSKANSPEATAKAGTSGRSIGSKFLGRAGRTFSFGQKKHPGPLPKDDSAPSVPPLLNPNQASQERTRGMTASSSGTAKQDAHYMQQSDKRANMAAAKMEDRAPPRVLVGGRQAHAGKRVSRGSDAANLDDPLSTWAMLKSATDRPDSPLFDLPSPIPPHHKASYANPQTPRIAKNLDEDEDFLEENYGSIQHLPGRNEYATGSPSARARRQGKQAAVHDPVQDALDDLDDPNDDDDGDLFEGRPSRFARALNKSAAPKAPELPEKIMTSEEYERYAAIKAREAHDDSSDEINYDDDEEDEVEKSKEITRQRRKQEASMASYRQQQMKVTGTPSCQLAQPSPSGRPGLPSSMSAPQLGQVKGPELTGASDLDDDEDTPLAIIQAQAYANAANKNRSSSRLNNTSSNPNMRASVNSTALLRPTSMVGDPNASRRHSALPAFARGLPQDPYLGAPAMGRPGGMRETMLFNDFIPASPGVQSPGDNHVGGLIGVIDREEKAKALRRGSPSVDAARFLGGGGYLGTGGHRQGMESMGGMQQHMMYNHPGMAGSGMQGMPPGYMQQQQQYDQGYYQMNQTLMNPQRMSQYMQQQQQSQFMNMGHGGQGNNMPQQQFFRMQGNASAMNLGSYRASFVGDGPMDARRVDYNMRTMSMVQPGSAPMIHPGYAGSVRSSAHGYAPSVAPSERSNVGLPSRYRAVSHAAASGGPSRSGGGERARSAMRVVNKPPSVDDDDDEQGWEAMKAKRDKRMSSWKAKKSVSSIL